MNPVLQLLSNSEYAFCCTCMCLCFEVSRCILTTVNISARRFCYSVGWFMLLVCRPKCGHCAPYFDHDGSWNLGRFKVFLGGGWGGGEGLGGYLTNFLCCLENAFSDIDWLIILVARPPVPTLPSKFKPWLYATVGLFVCSLHLLSVQVQFLLNFHCAHRLLILLITSERSKSKSKLLYSVYWSPSYRNSSVVVWYLHQIWQPDRNTFGMKWPNKTQDGGTSLGLANSLSGPAYLSKCISKPGAAHVFFCPTCLSAEISCPTISLAYFTQSAF